MTKEVSDSIWEIAQDLYNNADFNVNRHGELESFEVMDYEDYNGYYRDCTEEEFNGAVLYLNELLADVKYYDGKLELNDNHTIWDIDFPEGAEFYDEEYSFLYDQAIRQLEEEIGTEVYGLGRSGRHICVEDTFRNLTKLDEFKTAQEKWEKWLINEVEKQMSSTKVEEDISTPKGDKVAVCLNCGANIAYNNYDVEHDIDGDYIECPSCHATFDVDYDNTASLLNKKIEVKLEGSKKVTEGLRQDTIDAIDLAINEIDNGNSDDPDWFNEKYDTYDKLVQGVLDLIKSNIKYGSGVEKEPTSAVNFSGKDEIINEIKRQLAEWGYEESDFGKKTEDIANIGDLEESKKIKTESRYIVYDYADGDTMQDEEEKGLEPSQFTIYDNETNDFYYDELGNNPVFDTEEAAEGYIKKNKLNENLSKDAQDVIYTASDFNELLDILDNMYQDAKVQKARNLVSHAYTHVSDDEEDEELENIKGEVISILTEVKKTEAKPQKEDIAIWDKIGKIVDAADNELDLDQEAEYDYDEHIKFVIYRDYELDDIFAVFTYLDGEEQEDLDTGDIHLEDLDATLVDIVKKLTNKEVKTEAEDMSKVKDDVKNAVDKSNSTDLEKDQVKGSIDVLKTDEESAIAGYDEFTKETAKVVDKELSDEIDNQMQEIVDDEKEHIEKLDTIKSALGESKSIEKAIKEAGDYNLFDVNTFNELEEIVSSLKQLDDNTKNKLLKMIKDKKKYTNMKNSSDVAIQSEELANEIISVISKLDTIKSASGENKKTEAEDLSYTDSDTKNCKVYYAVNTSGYKSLGLIVNDKDKKFQVVAGQKLRSGSKTAKKSKKQIWDMAKELKANGYEEVRGPSSVAGTVDENKELKTEGLRQDTIDAIDIAINEIDNGNNDDPDWFNERYNTYDKLVQGVLDLMGINIKYGSGIDKEPTSAVNFSGKDEIINEIKRQLAEWGYDETYFNGKKEEDCTQAGSIQGPTTVFGSKEKKEEAEESGTATIDLHTDLVPIINMYQYDMYYMLEDYVGVTTEKLDEMMLDFAKPLIEEQIKDVLPSAQITFGEFTHPKYYKLFSNLNDILDFNVTYNVAEYEALKQKAVQDPDFEQYLQDHYTSYDGFMSFFADNIRDFEEQEGWKQFVSVLSYYLPNNEDENYNEMCNYIYENTSNYDIMPRDSEVDYVVEEINTKVSNGEIELNKENIISITKDLMSYLDEEDQEIIINGVLEVFDLEESKKTETYQPMNDLKIAIARKRTDDMIRALGTEVTGMEKQTMYKNTLDSLDDIKAIDTMIKDYDGDNSNKSSRMIKDLNDLKSMLSKKTEGKKQWYGYNLIGEYTDKAGIKHTDEVAHAFNTEYLKHYAEEHKQELTKYDNMYIKDTAVNEITTTDGIINKNKRISITEAVGDDNEIPVVNPDEKDYYNNKGFIISLYPRSRCRFNFI